jgi:hypothetical protein
MNLLTRVLPWLIAIMAVLPAALRAEEKEELTWYAIELIVFERSSELGRDAEVWSADPGLPNTAGAIELSVDGIVAPAPPGELPVASDSQAPAAGTDPLMPRTSLPPAFRLIPASELRLTEVWNRLEKSSAYRPLLHVGWIQPGYASEDAPLVHIRNSNAALGAVAAGSNVDGEALPSISEPGYAPTLSSRITVARDRTLPALDGTLRVHRARYLHVQADLLYYRPLAGGSTPASSSGNQTTPAPLPDSPDTALIEQLLAEADATPRLFRLTESRRMRSRELHYLDHPLFGALVEAWPLELPAAAAPAAAPAPGETKTVEPAVGAEPAPLTPAPSGGGSGG